MGAGTIFALLAVGQRVALPEDGLCDVTALGSGELESGLFLHRWRGEVEDLDLDRLQLVFRRYAVADIALDVDQAVEG